METRFRDLGPGDSAEVIGFDDSAKAYTNRLLSMGLTPGAKVQVVKVAPMGDPVEIHVRGYNLSLRKDEASVVKLRRM